MTNPSSIASNGELTYATTFTEKILGVQCEVDISIPLNFNEPSIVVVMKRMLSANTVLSISRQDLARLSVCMKLAQARVDLLDKLVEDANDHQLNFSLSGASLIIAKPPKKPARFALDIGLFHREGPLTELSPDEIDNAVMALDKLAKRVITKLGK